MDMIVTLSSSSKVNFLSRVWMSHTDVSPRNILVHISLPSGESAKHNRKGGSPLHRRINSSLPVVILHARRVPSSEDEKTVKTFKSVDTPDSAHPVIAVAFPPPAVGAGYRNTTDRSAFPASATGPLMYPQSPIFTQSFRSAGVPGTPKR